MFPLFSEPWDMVIAILCAPVGMIVGAPFCLAGAIVIGIPATWPFRRIIFRHPRSSILAYGAIGAVIGAALWVFGGAAEPTFLAVGGLYGAASGGAWIWTLSFMREWLDPAGT
ncbi:hypothetical protein [Allosphingosinicella deserti]|uniref:hypothetical protein n=1 Tax=Allosphingosinicella deserti TaxID=2116704 RepID=UPI001304A31D|nr:hypothetical protein [Sphingomonas deserti]